MTLIELTVSVVLVSVIITATVSFYLFGTNTYSKGIGRAEIQRNSRVVAQHMENSLRNCDDISLLSTGLNNSYKALQLSGTTFTGFPYGSSELSPRVEKITEATIRFVAVPGTQKAMAMLHIKGKDADNEYAFDTGILMNNMTVSKVSSKVVLGNTINLSTNILYYRNVFTLSACFYKHVDYGGYAVALAPGDYTTAQLVALGITDNDISSAKVPQGLIVVMYSGDNFTGTVKGLTSDDPNFNSGYYKFNDLMSSVKIYSSTGPTFFQHTEYNGYSVSLPAGNYTSSQLVAAGIHNNDISSLMAPYGYTVTMYDGDNFTGTSYVLTGDTRNFWGINFNDKMTSVKIKLN